MRAEAYTKAGDAFRVDHGAAMLDTAADLLVQQARQTGAGCGDGTWRIDPRSVAGRLVTEPVSRAALLHIRWTSIPNSGKAAGNWRRPSQAAAGVPPSSQSERMTRAGSRS